MLKRKLGRKQMRMVYAQGRGGQTTANIPTPEADRARFCLTDTVDRQMGFYGRVLYETITHLVIRLRYRNVILGLNSDITIGATTPIAPIAIPR